MIQNELVTNDDDFNWKEEIHKYLFFWKYFIFSIFICCLASYFYLRYTHEVFETSAKIKILDKKESNLELPSAENIFKNSQINLQNESEILKSFTILRQVVINLELTTSIFAIGDIQESLILEYPFEIVVNKITNSSYRLFKDDKGIEVVDLLNDKVYQFPDFSTKLQKHDLPFDIVNLDLDAWDSFDNHSYQLSFSSIKHATLNLRDRIEIERVGDKSDILKISHSSSVSNLSKKIINELIYVFNQDGIKDRQLIHKRTIDFVNSRYSYLSLELDSIEIKKQLFKIKNDLVDISANSNLSLQKSLESEENLFTTENQISIIKLLIDNLENIELELLPSNIGVDNYEINNLIADYNQNIQKRKKLILSAGYNNPSVKLMESYIVDSKSNIIFSLKSYLNQLKDFEKKLLEKFNKFDNQVTDIPEKEKVLRAIERNQQIKEALYLFLLQKREEAEVSYAITEPSIKVVEYAITNSLPKSPNSKNIYLISIIIGLSIPFSLIYLIFLFDNKVNSRDDLDFNAIGGSFIGEVPFIDSQNPNDMINDSRSILSESYRMITSNLKFLLPHKETSNVIAVTSTIKHEGKTFNAFNLSLSLATFDKKVLLIGADMHNPQLHRFVKTDKNVNGLSNYLSEPNKNSWMSSATNYYEDLPKHHILLSGPIPPNALQLLNNGNLDNLINEAKKEFDYVVIDLPPTLITSDAITVSHLVDMFVYVIRTNITNKDIMKHPQELIKLKKLNNVGFILNGSGTTNKYGYSYKYSYGYKYSYNYGYGYGYGEDS